MSAFSDGALVGARTLIDVCSGLRPGETALVITDCSTEDIGGLVLELAKSAGASVAHHLIPPASRHGTEPPAATRAAMATADVIFALPRMSIAHTRARAAASARGARFLSLPDYGHDVLERDALRTDFRALAPLADAFGRSLADAHTLRLTTAAGTDLTMSSTGRSANSAPGFVRGPGDLASPPDAEANVPIAEDRTNGRLVVDGSIPCPEIGLLVSPVQLEITAGRITAIEGELAATLTSILDAIGDPRTRIAAELGVGLNPRAELCGRMLEDEGTRGTVHVGFGSNITIGGHNGPAFHLDMIVRRATLTANGTALLSNGEVSLDV